LLESVFEHQDALIREAIDEFAARGYDNASINRILARVGMSKGQFYYHFADKEALYLALVELTIARRREWLRQRPVTEAGGFLDAVRQQMVASVAFARADPAVDKFVTSILAERGQPIFTKIIDRVGFRPGGELSHLVRAAHARGEFRKGIPLSFIERVVAGLVNSLPQIVELRQSRALEPDIELFVEFLAHGLAPADAQTRSRPRAKQRNRR
jgi:AcrR family transcriptional regulator